jgi:lipoprotein-releasing system permease protein
LAHNLGIIPGDKVTLVTPQANVTPAGILPRLKRFTVVGIFQVGNNEYDGSLALLHLEDAAKLMQMPGRVSGLRLKLDDIFDAPVVTQKLAQRLAGGYQLSDWTRQHAIYFRAVDIEKKMMFVILTLIVAVAAFNIVSTMVMVVTDKQADIAILRTLGTTPSSVMAIFMVQGTVIGVIGTLLGMVGGVSLALNVPDIVPFFERLFSFQLFPQNVYLINKLPSEMRWGDVFQITSLAFLLSFSATLYPAWRAARTQPAEALRYE